VAFLKKMRNGYSTGTCAAAASKAALQRLLNDKVIKQVDIILPDGSSIDIPVQTSGLDQNGAIAEVIKDGGDDQDATHGMSIFARVEIIGEPGITICAGSGIGKVTKPGLSVPVGEPAINPIPLKMIRSAVQELLPPGKGVQITIFAPEGEKVAKKTFNSRLGILGGISILGTTGLVRPMSQEAYLDSLVPQINQAIALGHRNLVLTPGGMGARMATQMGIHEDAVVQTSNFIGSMLGECAKQNIEGILLFGHIGKLIKVAGGIFNTHSKVADARREILAAHAALCGAPVSLIKEIMELNTIDASHSLLKKYQLEQVYTSVAQSASSRCKQLLGDGITVGTVLYALDGTILAYDNDAYELGRKLGWNL
jgi:cobalt-precorrin-5B (C1)-methyltransferase